MCSSVDVWELVVWQLHKPTWDLNRRCSWPFLLLSKPSYRRASGLSTLLLRLSVNPSSDQSSLAWLYPVILISPTKIGCYSIQFMQVSLCMWNPFGKTCTWLLQISFDFFNVSIFCAELFRDTDNVVWSFQMCSPPSKITLITPNPPRNSRQQTNITKRLGNIPSVLFMQHIPHCFCSSFLTNFKYT